MVVVVHSVETGTDAHTIHIKLAENPRGHREPNKYQQALSIAVQLCPKLNRVVLKNAVMWASVSFPGEEMSAFMRALCKYPSIKTLHFALIETDDKGIEALTKMLEVNTHWQQLILRCCRIGTEALQALMNALQKNTSLVSLELDSNDLTREHAKILASALETNKSIQALDLSHNNLGGGIKFLAKALEKNTSLQVLELYYNKVNKEDMKALTEMVKENNALRELHIAEQALFTGVDGDDIVLLANAVKSNSTLQTFNLYGFQVDPELRVTLDALLDRKKQQAPTVNPDRTAPTERPS